MTTDWPIWIRAAFAVGIATITLWLPAAKALIDWIVY